MIGKHRRLNWFGRQWKVWLIVLLALITSSCLPTTETNANRPATPKTTIPDSQPGNEGVVTREPKTVVSTSTPVETATPEIVAVLHPDVVRSFDREQCPDYCWHNIMLGQSEAEVLEAIRSDPTTNTASVYPTGDFVHIEQFEDARTGIDWDILGIPNQRYRRYGSLFLDSDRVTFLVLPVEPPFPLQAVLDKFGEPELLMFGDGGTGFAFFSLYYPAERVSFLVKASGNPTAITGASMVEVVSYSNAEIAQEYYCIIGFLRWGGLGDISKYFPPNNEGLYIDTLPEKCVEP